ncbi:MAG: hypothetical protein ACK419_00750 [Pyrinomonadaceae bacterium]
MNPREETQPSKTEPATGPIPQKKNQRSGDSLQETRNSQKIEAPLSEGVENSGKYKYLYEFESPKHFYITRIQIEHDESGKGKITFWKKDLDEEISEPINLSKTALEKINSLFQALNFLNSNEEYQSTERNYSHLGTTKISLKTPEKERSVQFNWSERKEARALADEYRKISNQFIWQFEINLARENQPLDAPRLMDRLDSYLKRNEISDPLQMLPLLEELVNDERIPLIARNHAKRLVEQIKKTK